jgi:protein-disulfide isomerase
VLKQLRERYPEKVRVVYRHFPLDSIHPHARPAAEASMCAGEQDRFWEFHDLLFANTKALSDDDLAGYAEQLSLDAEVFQACIAEGRFRDAVQQDLDDGRRAGVSGTPSFFVNGRMLGGAVPLEEFVKVIESELQRQGGAAS